MRLVPPRAAVAVPTEKRPAAGARGMVVTNHPLASAAGAEMLLAGGGAVDAAVSALFALSVVEPMMVGPLGGGVIHLRTPDGRHVILDGLSRAPAAARPDMFRPCRADGADREVEGRANRVGAAAVAVPGALQTWLAAHARHGRLPLADVLAPAIGLARRGFVVTPYLAGAVEDTAGDLARDATLARLFLPGGRSIRPGERLVQSEAAEALGWIAGAGTAALVDGPIGRALVEAMGRAGGLVGPGDLAAEALIERAPIRATYRGFEVLGPPPPAAAGLHIAQMLAILAHFDVAGLCLGTLPGAHLLAEALKIAFADRPVAAADPAFVPVPTARLLDRATATARAASIDPLAARSFAPQPVAGESRDTTHLTVADGEGTVVAATQTLNGLFGACMSVPGTGLLLNNYMFNFDPRPGRPQSIAPGKRVFSSMAPVMVTEAGAFRAALGCPGSLRIFPAVFQALVGLIDHGLTLQEALEMPRLYCDGGPLELEPGIADAVADGLAALGHRVERTPRVGGGMNAILRTADGELIGAACWRADGTPVGIAGGLARAGVRFGPL